MYARINLMHFKPGMLDKGHQSARVSFRRVQGPQGIQVDGLHRG